MRKHKLGDEAFAYYVSLGPERSYQAVADHCKVSKRTVVATAKRDKWAERLAKIEHEARVAADLKLQDSMEAMNLRHSKMLRAMASRAAKGLQEFPITNGMDAARLAEMVIKLERLMAGEPSEHMQATVAEASRDEVRRFVTNRPVGADGPDDY